MRDLKTIAYGWIRCFCDKIMELVLVFAITVISYTILLYFISFLWVIYVETPVGQRFLTLHNADIAFIAKLQNQNFFILSLRVSLLVIKVCLVLGAVSQVFLMIRFVYDARSFFLRLILWGVPCAVLSSTAIYNTYEIGWSVSFFLGFIPSLILFNYCLRFSSGLLPEISILHRR